MGKRKPDVWALGMNTEELPVTIDSLTPEVAGNITPRIHYDKREMQVATEAKLKATVRSLERTDGAECR